VAIAKHAYYLFLSSIIDIKAKSMIYPRLIYLYYHCTNLVFCRLICTNAVLNVVKLWIPLKIYNSVLIIVPSYSEEPRL